MRVESLQTDTLPPLEGMEYLMPELDESVILEGSLAEWGFRQGELKGEVFLKESRKKTVLEIYPLDGKDQPVKIEVSKFDHSDDEVLYAIKLAMQHRSTQKQKEK